jgi:hypothetical protein
MAQLLSFNAVNFLKNIIPSGFFLTQFCFVTNSNTASNNIHNPFYMRPKSLIIHPSPPESWSAIESIRVHLYLKHAHHMLRAITEFTKQ